MFFHFARGYESLDSSFDTRFSVSGRPIHAEKATRGLGQVNARGRTRLLKQVLHERTDFLKGYVIHVAL